MKVEDAGDAFKVTVTVANTGDRTGTETVQLYMQDVTATLVRPVKELKGFTKVTLDPGASVDVTMSLKKSDMGFYDNDANYRIEDGKFNIFVGTNSKECMKQEIDVKF